LKLLLSGLFRVIGVALLWGLYIYKFYNDFDHDYMFKDELHFILLTVAILSSLFFLFVEYNLYQSSKKITSYVSVIVIGLSVSSFFYLRNKLRSQDNTPVVLTIIDRSFSLGYTKIDFRKNGTYKCTLNGFMNSYSERGKYIIRDSLIIFQDDRMLPYVNSLTLVMKSKPKHRTSKKQSLISTLLFGKRRNTFQDTLPDIFVYKADQQGFLTDSIPHFKVIK